LHTVWEQQLFRKDNLLLNGADPVFILKPGFRNSDSGPDFNQAKIRIGDLEWIGSVEIHVRASEWNLHQHHFDPAYQSVVLHVVWEKDTDVYRSDGSLVPCLEIQHLVPLEVMLRYRSLVEVEKKSIACATFLPKVKPVLVISMQERVLVERLERKAKDILARFESNNKDWLQTFFQTIAWSLGLRVNSEPMLVLSQSIKINILASQSWSPEKLAAIFLGQGGYLKDVNGPAGMKLKSEYQFISQKYGLSQPPIVWKLFRLRPGAFPVQRLVLLAIISSNLPIWFDQLTKADDHFEFFENVNSSIKHELLSSFLQELGYKKNDFGLSKFLKDSLVINVFAPFLTALSLHHDQREWIEKSLKWLSKLAPEENTITKTWKNLGMKVHSAEESQAFTELYNNYCLEKKCMNCQIGIDILKNP
jgi:hypothetical protein